MAYVGVVVLEAGEDVLEVEELLVVEAVADVVGERDVGEGVLV